MAREKMTARAAARRRSRAVARSAAAANANAAASDALVADEPEAVTPAAEAPRRPMFRLPNFREDARLLPDMFRAKPLLWAPFIMLLAGLPITIAIPAQVPSGDLTWEILATYWQMVFLPQGLITYLVAGYLAQRAAYLVGLLVGVFNALLLAVGLLVLRPNSVLAQTTADQQSVTLLFMGYSLVVGPIIAVFAAWYRGFLSRMSDQNRQRRADREAEMAKKRREEARAARRPVRTKTGA